MKVICSVKALIYLVGATLFSVSKTRQTVFKPSALQLHLTFVQRGHDLTFICAFLEHISAFPAAWDYFAALPTLAYAPAAHNRQAQQVKTIYPRAVSTLPCPSRSRTHVCSNAKEKLRDSFGKPLQVRNHAPLRPPP